MKYYKYAKTIHNAGEEVLYWIEHNLVNHLKKEKENQTDIEHIIDYLCSGDAPKRLKKMSYKQALNKTNEWQKTLVKKAGNIEEKEADIEVVLDFKDGFKFVKLIGKNAYDREGKLMSHCVSSYYEKDDEIYSLRDSKNNPHCTVSSNSQQIKGKGNGSINPKYIDYVVKFLEFKGINVRDSEMENLGYIVPKFKEFVKNKLFKNKYLFESEKIIYKKGYKIVKSLTDVKDDGKFLLDCSIEVNNNLFYNNVYSISGYIYMNKNSKLEIHNLKSSGDIHMYENSKLEIPNLKSSGYISMNENSKLEVPNLKSSGGISMHENSKLELPNLKSSGGISMHKNSKLELPKHLHEKIL